MKKKAGERTAEDYADMLYLSRPVSRRHPPMSMEERAAQFSPFAALSGYEDAVRETARYTEPKAELEEDRRQELDWKLNQLAGSEAVRASFTYFRPDTRKDGGAYVTAEGEVRRVDPVRRRVVLADGREIPIDFITDIVLPEVWKQPGGPDV